MGNYKKIRLSVELMDSQSVTCVRVLQRDNQVSWVDFGWLKLLSMVSMMASFEDGKM